MAEASERKRVVSFLCTNEEWEEFCSLAGKAKVRPADIAKRGAFKEARELAKIADEAA